jgi:hypothetical protein
MLAHSTGFKPEDITNISSIKDIISIKKIISPVKISVQTSVIIPVTRNAWSCAQQLNLQKCKLPEYYKYHKLQFSSTNGQPDNITLSYEGDEEANLDAIKTLICDFNSLLDTTINIKMDSLSIKIKMIVMVHVHSATSQASAKEFRKLLNVIKSSTMSGYILSTKGAISITSHAIDKKIDLIFHHYESWINDFNLFERKLIEVYNKLNDLTMPESIPAATTDEDEADTTYTNEIDITPYLQYLDADSYIEIFNLINPQTAVNLANEENIAGNQQNIISPLTNNGIFSKQGNSNASSLSSASPIQIESTMTTSFTSNEPVDTDISPDDIDFILEGTLYDFLPLKELQNQANEQGVKRSRLNSTNHLNIYSKSTNMPSPLPTSSSNLSSGGKRKHSN